MSGQRLEDLRAANRQALLALLATSGPYSRAELARRTGLSRTTVSSLVADLIGAGHAHETGVSKPHRGGSGRPPVLIAVTAPPGHVAGVDIGHRHIRVAVADRAAQVLAEERTEIDTDLQGTQTLDAAARLVASTAAKAGLEAADLLAVGVCVPSPLDQRSARVGQVVLPGWHALAPADELGRRLGLPVTADNDANLGALAEHHHGAARDHDDVVYLKLASGVGAGLILGGRLHRGAAGLAGELGHVRAVEPGLVCRCGSRGCLETEVSTNHLRELLSPSYGDDLTTTRLLELDAAADPEVRRVLTEAGTIAGRVLGEVCTLLNPGVVVIGGPLGESPTLVGAVGAAVERYAQPEAAATTHVVAGALGQRAELVGAVAMAIARAAEEPA